MSNKVGGLGNLPKGLEWISPNLNKQSQQVVETKPIAEEPVIEKPKVVKPTRVLNDGLPEGYTRATFIIKQEYVDRLRALAYVKKTSIKDLVETAMGKFLKDKDVKSILMEALEQK